MEKDHHLACWSDIECDISMDTLHRDPYGGDQTYRGRFRKQHPGSARQLSFPDQNFPLSKMIH